ncbi:MAG: ROK family transcriptional regulator [Bacillota bacterium]
MTTTMRPSNIREENMKQIVKVIRESDKLLSRAQIAREISLSPPSVSKIINILIEKNILNEKKEGNSSVNGGRRPILLEINKNCGNLVGVFIERGRITVILTDIKGNIIDKKDIEYDEKKQFDRVEYLINNIQDLLVNNDISEEKILFIGISVSGIFDAREGGIKLAPNIKRWEGIPIKRKFNEKFNCKIYIENKNNLAVLGERWKGKLNGCKNAIHINVDKGIGAGILINGEIYDGNNNIAGEVGFMVSDKENISRNKDDYGSFEKICSTRFIVKKARKLLNDNDIIFDDIIKELKKDNPEIREMLKEVCQQLAIVIGNIICVLNPEKVVINGQFKEIAREFEEYINNIISQIVPTNPEIIFSELGRKSFYLGSIRKGLDSIEDNLISYYFQD